MALMNTEQSYGSVAKFFHWTLAILVILMLAGGLTLGSVKNSPYAGTIFNIHKSIGFTILILMTLRLLWRIVNPLPQLPISTPEWQRLAARSVHRLFYVAVIGMALAGWGMATAAGYPVNFWWLVKINMPWIPKSEAFQQGFATAHYVFARVLIALIILHMLASLKHYFINQDGVVNRMWRQPKTKF